MHFYTGFKSTGHISYLGFVRTGQSFGDLTASDKNSVELVLHKKSDDVGRARGEARGEGRGRGGGVHQSQSFLLRSSNIDEYRKKEGI